MHNVPDIAAIKVRTLMPLGWMTGAMHRGARIVEIYSYDESFFDRLARHRLISSMRCMGFMAFRRIGSSISIAGVRVSRHAFSFSRVLSRM